MARRSFEERFWDLVDVRGPDECWPWKGYVNARGYAQWATRDLEGKPRTLRPTRVAWELTIGYPVPDGLQLDHVCHSQSDCAEGDRCPHRQCSNPAHLEPVTPLENARRSAHNHWAPPIRSHCSNGHSLAGDNLREWRGRRLCRQCNREKCARWNAAHRKSAA